MKERERAVRRHSSFLMGENQLFIVIRQPSE